jgi:hypothetical protein
MEKMRPVEAILGSRERGKRKAVEGISSSIYFIHCKNFCKCHNVSSSSTIKNKIEKQKKSLLFSDTFDLPSSFP